MARVTTFQLIQGCVCMAIAFGYLIYHYVGVMNKFHPSNISTKEILSKDKLLSFTIMADTSSSSSSKSSIKYSLCVFTALDKGAFLLPQWVDYHTIVGVNQFYLVNNCDEDSSRKSIWLKFYEQLGMVTQYEYPDNNICLDVSKKKQDGVNEMLLRAKSSCEWIMPLDVDEYLYPRKEKNSPNLLSPSVIGLKKFKSMILSLDMAFMNNVLINSTESLYRLPIYTMSSHKHENHTITSLIDHYKNGQFSNIDKLLLRSSYLSTLEQNAKLSLRKEGDGKVSISSLFLSSTLDGELAPLSADKSMCLIPTTLIYIKHFEALSYEDYMRVSTDKDKSRQKWAKYYFKRRCPLLNEATTRLMSRKMVELYLKNHQTYCQNKGNVSTTNDIRHTNWLNAEETIC